MLTWTTMRLRNRLYLHGVLPLVERERGRGLARLVRHYAEYERLSRDEVRHRQWKAFQELLQHAYSTTRFYRNRFDAIGLQPQDIREPGDVPRIPALTRDDLKNHLPEIVSSAFSPAQLCESHTGGTTNAPVDFLRERASLVHKEAIQWILNGWAGFRPGDKVMYFWGAQADFAANPSWRWRLYDEVLMRRRWMQASKMSEEVLAHYRTVFERFRPRIIYGYPTTIAHFCHYLKRTGLSSHRPEAIISTAEHLEDSRTLIEEALRAPVFEHYGAREFGMIAGECEAHRGQHIHPAISYVDFAPVEHSGEDPMAEIFVTDLFNRGMPLIRYRSEDFVTFGASQCPCGRPFDTIDHFVGRRFAMFHFANGESAMGVGLAYRVTSLFPPIVGTQFVQLTYEDFEFRYVADQEMPALIADKISRMLQEFFKAKINWNVVRVKEIPRERSGKIRPFISHVVPRRPEETSP